MKRTLIFPLGLLVVGLLTGCPDKKAPETEEPTPITDPTPEPQTAAQVEEPPVEEPKAEVDKEVFIKAAFEVTCVRARITDSEAQKETLAEVFPRYGFDETSFADAEKALAGETTVQEAVKARMEGCTDELAAKLKESGADAAAVAVAEEPPKETKTADKKKAPAKSAVESGRYSGAVSGGGLENAKLDITVRNDGGISANFVGSREGKRFALGLKGDLSKDGKFNLSGEKGTLNAKVTGAFKSGLASGQVTGRINEKGLSAAFNAKK